MTMNDSWEKVMFFGRNRTNTLEDLGKGKIISFLNQKGGVGKTTMCFNTAHALAQKGHKVLVIDMDPQANMSYLFGHEESRESISIFNLLLNSIKELKHLHSSTIFEKVVFKSELGVDLLPAAQELSGFELCVAAINSPRQTILKKYVEQAGLRKRYDYILIDCPPTLGLLVVNSICVSDGVIVPFRPDDFSMKGLEHFYRMLSDIEDMDIVKLPEIITHIPNLMDTRRKQEESDLDEIKELIRKVTGDDRFIAPFFNKAQIVKSQAAKKSIYAYNSKEYQPLHEQFNKIANLIDSWNDSTL
ncbi:ParA family protein [Halobacteriovorax sp. XZX-3]|uniref:ParA family protein n=1 Tax=unclassified Halobacteriovorax TaxID=2639665 RepID=UPI003712F2D8